ncbi:antitoxin [Nocardiopsis gilva YIM 90087]|uniref:Antitoxin n=1 Tax=Nocardiopsis gilva YIM 90087 TaxID=1235441 RepID=A0A223S767_9ACTN|nr:hypothetical protein [Nocardiopsis gilva]ASU83978.1 antitoxin [Nocardiopsis gilva YIM 90087]
MIAITIRNVSDSVATALKVRAAQEGKSLQAYALDVLTREAKKPTLAEIADRAGREADVSLTTDDVLGAIEDARERR